MSRPSYACVDVPADGGGGAGRSHGVTEALEGVLGRSGRMGS